MSRRNQPDRQTFQIGSASYPNIAALIANGTLVVHPRPERETDDPLKGIRAQTTYTLRAGVTFEVLNDEMCRVEDTVLQAQLSHLPTPAYRALVNASPAFEQYDGLDPLLQQLRDGSLAGQSLQDTLESTVAAGRTPNCVPSLVVLPRSFSATWLPEEIYLFQTASGHWFLSLSFRTTFRRCSRALRPAAIGLDLGLDPVTVTSDGQTDLFYSPTPLPVVRPQDLSPAAWHLYQQLVYASGRLDAEAVIGGLVHGARVVFAERLTHRGMTPRFVHGGRDQAIHDYHFSWLPQYLNAARIPFQRVDPAGTSITCHCCQTVDRHNRVGTGARFNCRKCGYQGNAHGNAARNVQRLGLATCSWWTAARTG